MADKTTSQATPAVEAAQAATPEPASFDNTIDVSAESEAQATTGFEGLFDTENVSEAELMGEEGTPEQVTEPDPKPSETKGAEPSPAKDEKKADEPVVEEGKPPKGFVPIQALHQERGQRQLLSQEMARIRSELEAIKSGKATAPDVPKPDLVGPEFKVLSEAEFDALLEEDPVEAIKYDRKLRAHEAKEAQKAQSANQEQSLIERSIGMMAEAVPGLYDEGSDVNAKLSNFAVEKGFMDLDGLALVTDPRTRIIDANGKPRMLGETASYLVVMLNNLFQEVSKDDGNKALTEKIRAEVTKEVLSKITLPAGAEHHSIGDIPGDAGDTINLSLLSEADFAKLSEADQRRLLGG